jgi:hypothetical protein
VGRAVRGGISGMRGINRAAGGFSVASSKAFRRAVKKRLKNIKIKF